MSFKLIVNADDFGPIDFINQGIYHHLSQGNIDSTQVLVNMDPVKLKTNLKRLHGYVPADRTFDLGVHFTLTSGGPLTGHENNHAAWGGMVEKTKQGVTQFKDYTKFDYDYAKYFSAIEKEFETQRDVLIRLTEEVNSEMKGEKLVVNSVSNHHNIFTIAPDLFEVYVRVAQGAPGKPLKIRSPKASPYNTIKTYYNLVLPLRNKTDDKGQRKLMEEMCFNFSNNNYTKKKAVKIESPAYIDIDFYKGIGSLAIGKVKETKIEDRISKFEEMINRAKAYVPKKDIEPVPAIVEFVFHLGASDEVTKGQSFEQMAAGYPGVTHKYFDNRLTELLCLNELSKDAKFKDLIKTKVSWDECGEVTYRQVK
ncbi:MAG: putative glycoside hydrolase/deacetylase ChbG (UPF0249 family) [Crocinitomicaceae bacterium]|jgi:predicted glycoside hydrolase/deacetylase ChbG (UPF0249 family)